MEDAELLQICFHITAQDHSADDSSPSLTLASCLLAEREEIKIKKKTAKAYTSFSSSYLLRIKTVYSPLLGLRNLCAFVSQSMDVLPVSCFKPLDGDAQLKNSSQLPPFCDHMIWASTK